MLLDNQLSHSAVGMLSVVDLYSERFSRYFLEEQSADVVVSISRYRFEFQRVLLRSTKRQRSSKLERRRWSAQLQFSRYYLVVEISRYIFEESARDSADERFERFSRYFLEEQSADVVVSISRYRFEFQRVLLRSTKRQRSSKLERRRWSAQLQFSRYYLVVEISRYIFEESAVG
ncbi:putative sucrose-phosphate synthase 3-like [Dorcoceras hygrometricum]|uniref:Putative sucrose-phosphate synthase 3-like n=1 Tax=Dorcoceras hygrometricum TaxID=472368 RepID=A0A2Z7D7V7_9LAMI|nr:putative sucrose-phosphate synthase 3-like [Dorcoceras hygrometricum]